MKSLQERAKEYCVENVEGKPLTDLVVLESLVEFTTSQNKIILKVLDEMLDWYKNEDSGPLEQYWNHIDALSQLKQKINDKMT